MAKFSRKCKICDAYFEPDDDVVHVQGEGICHVSCTTELDQSLVQQDQAKTQFPDIPFKIVKALSAAERDKLDANFAVIYKSLVGTSKNYEVFDFETEEALRQHFEETMFDQGRFRIVLILKEGSKITVTPSLSITIEE